MYVVDAAPMALMFGPPQGVPKASAQINFVKIKGVWSAKAFELANDRVKEVFRDPKFLKLFTRSYKIDRSFPIKYVAGYSNDGSTIYLDCDLPDEFELEDGTKFDAAPYIVFHERVEKALIDLKGYTYQGSHQIAMGAEGAAYQAAGLDWEGVKKALWPFVVHCVSKPLGEAPAELDMTPYLDTNRDIPEGMDKPNAQKAFNPDQQRDDRGRWTVTGAGDPQVREWQMSADATHLLNPKYKDKTPFTLFHGTSSDAVESIREHGLVPMHGGGADATADSERGTHYLKYAIGDRAASVYVTPQLERATQFAGLVANEHDAKPVVLVAQIPKAEFLANAHVDERGDPREQSRPVTDADFVRYQGKVKPEWIVGEIDLTKAVVSDDAVKTYLCLIVDNSDVRKFSEDEARDEHGRWSAEGGTTYAGLTHVTSPITPAETASVREYVATKKTSTVQNALRAGTALRGANKERVQNIDNAIDKSGVLKDFTTYRGVSAAGWDRLAGAEVGSEIAMPGYTSTTIDPDVVGRFAGDDGGKLVIQVPAGANALAVTGRFKPPVYHAEHGVTYGAVNLDEKEVLLPRGTHFGVVSVDRPSRTMTLRVLPSVSKFSEDEARDEFGRWSKNDIPSDVYTAVRNYIGSGYRGINNSLRGKGDTSIGDHQDQVDLLDQFTHSATLGKDGTVYRAVVQNSDTARSFASLKPGDVVVDKGYMSVSASADALGQLITEAGASLSAKMDIQVSKGQHYGPARHVSIFETEQEMLMPRGSRLTFTGISPDYHYQFTLAKG